MVPGADGGPVWVGCCVWRLSKASAVTLRPGGGSELLLKGLDVPARLREPEAIF